MATDSSQHTSTPDAAALYRAVQILAENLTRGISNDVTEAAGLRARDRTDELVALGRILARTMSAYGTPARDVLAATDVPDDVVAALDR